MDLFTRFRSWRHRRRWNKRWGSDDHTPQWEIEGVAEPVRQAVSDGWLEPGMSLLDIGCGRGDMAAWLAEAGFEVLGVDFSDNAIKLARREHRVSAQLNFQVVDVTKRGALTRQFDGLVDRGCLHTLRDGLTQAYASNVATWARTGTRFLLLMHYRNTTPEAREAQVRSLLEAEWELLDVQPTRMDGPASKKEILGGAFRLVKR